MDDWVIRKRGYFYRPNKAGYTQHLETAGRYSKEDALAEQLHDPDVFAYPLSHFGVHPKQEEARSR